MLAQGDPLLVRACLRTDVKCSLHHANGAPYYQLEDPLNGKFYRLGLSEWYLVRELDGKRVLRDCVQRSQPHVGLQDSEVTERDAVALVRWLVQVQLVTLGNRVTHPIYESASATRQAPKPLFNPLFLKIPLFNPDRMLERCLPYLCWSISPIAFVIWLAVCLYACFEMLGQWDRFVSSATTILAPHNWLWLFVVWCVLKAVHELYHGLICKKYGGEVPRCGIIMILFSPIAFVDVTSSWRFRSKWHRIYTAAGGMYIELFVASVAAIVWARTDHPLLAQTCQNIVLMASLSTLLCNANFLMRFDGYYILTDLLGIQNLYTKGQQYLRYLNRRYLLALPVQSPLQRQARPGLMRCYAFAALIWRWCFYVGILVAASVMFRGAGLALAVLGAFTWWGLPALRYLRYVLFGNEDESPSIVRFGTVMAVSLLIVILIFQLPWPGGITAVGVVQYDPLTVYRVKSSGFVEEVHVQSGDLVHPGQVLATLRNLETELELAEIDLEIEESKVKSRILHQDYDVVAFQVETKKRESLQRQRKELQQQVDDLAVVATVRGRVIGRNLQSLVGQFLKSGAVLMSIGDESRKQIHLSIAQKDVGFFEEQIDKRPFVRIKGRSQPLREAILVRVDPRASRSLASPALAAPHGGPLAVAVDGNPKESGSGELETLQPRFSGVVLLPPERAQCLNAGELAHARMLAEGDTIGQHLLGVFRRWLTRQTQLSTG